MAAIRHHKPRRSRLITLVLIFMAGILVLPGIIQEMVVDEFIGVIASFMALGAMQLVRLAHVCTRHRR